MTAAKKALLTIVVLATAVAGGVWAWNSATVAHWVDAAQAADARNTSFKIDGHYRHYVEPGVLVLDLNTMDAAQTAPVDLWRGVMEIAEAGADGEHRFDRIVLARNGTPVFQMKGDDFYRLGSERGLGQNPVYQLRKLPEKLYLPNGSPAYGQWTGGLNRGRGQTNRGSE